MQTGKTILDVVGKGFCIGIVVPTCGNHIANFIVGVSRKDDTAGMIYLVGGLQQSSLQIVLVGIMLLYGIAEMQCLTRSTIKIECEVPIILFSEQRPRVGLNDASLVIIVVCCRSISIVGKAIYPCTGEQTCGIVIGLAITALLSVCQFRGDVGRQQLQEVVVVVVIDGEYLSGLVVVVSARLSCIL